MKRKCIQFRPAHHLTFRSPITGDLDARGDAILKTRSGYVVIVRVKDCLDDHGKWNEACRDVAPMHGPHTYSRSNMVYGGWRKQSNANGWPPHWTSPVYWVENGRVHRGTVHAYKDPTRNQP